MHATLDETFTVPPTESFEAATPAAEFVRPPEPPADFRVPEDAEGGTPPARAWTELIEDGADIANRDLPPPVELVAGLVPERSKCMLGSGSKSFKTWITIDMALAIAHGTPFWDRATERRRVLYVNLELKPDTFGRRLQAVAAAKGIVIEPGWLSHLALRGKLAGLTVFETVNRIIAAAEHCKAGCVVIDPLYKLNLEGDENSSRDQTLLFNSLDRITTEAGCTLLLNDHFSKGNQSEKDPLDAIRGSSAKGGDVDAAIVLRRHEVEGSFRVDVIHRELPPVEPFVVGWRFPLMELRADLDPDAMKKAKGGRRPGHDPRAFLAVIRSRTRENPISVSEWARTADVPRSTLSIYLGDLRARGWISTVGEGNRATQYITAPGLEAADRYAADS